MEMTVVGAEQPDLVSGVTPARRAAATEATWATVLGVRVGPWPADELHGPPGHLGLLVLDGLLCREVLVGHRSYVELLGEGDLLRPWDPPGGEASSGADTRWAVQTELRLAVLDRAFALRIGGFPEITAALMGRLVRRSRWLAFHVAVAHLPQLDARLRLMFWYLADRWGRMTPAGVVVPVRLSHERLGALVCARRSPVTRALARLRAGGEVTRLPDGTWMLGSRPPEYPQHTGGPAWCS
jgi:CRP/FNR family transcriptional regulator, cyclic AMP receptor protein